MKIKIEYPKSLARALELYDVPPMNEMAYGRKQMAAILVHQTNSIVSWWGYLYFLTHYEDRNNLLNHEKGKFLGLLDMLQKYEVKDANASKTKKKILDTHWGKGDRSIPGRELLTDKEAVIAALIGKLYAECEDPSEEILSEISIEFMKDAPTLIDLISCGTREDVRQYLDVVFPSRVAPQKKRRR